MLQKISIQNLVHQELQSARTGEKYSLSAVLTDGSGLSDLFVHHEIIPPGRRASGIHFHTRREEMVVALEGQITAWCNGVEVVLYPGDVVAFPPGKDGAHCLKNESCSQARVLVIASNPRDDAVEYINAL